jgi:glycosyltransferase involved in cell wall biosynthesis
MNGEFKVCHLTSAHSRFDTRIFLKECKSLSSIGYETSIVVADGKGDGVVDGVRIYDVGASSGRLDRILHAPSRVLTKARKLDCDLYHLHDPELIPIGLRLKKDGKIVVFDSHEDVPKQIMSKPYLNRLSRWAVSKAFAVYERTACKKFDAIVAATLSIREKFEKIGCRSIDINNYPLWGELSQQSIQWERKRAEVVYVGAIATIRGILQVVSALAATNSGARLQLAGKFNEPNLEKSAMANPGWKNVDVHGFVGREEVRALLANSVAGIVTFLPAPNHIDAQPNKMFEYMSAGVPVIGSHFPLWREIIEGAQCGICVDPLKPEQIANAIDYLVQNPVAAEQMGRNGKIAVKERYNWSVEEAKLAMLYTSLLTGREI